MSLSDVINELLVLIHHPRAGSYEIGDETRSCVNCGHEYQGNFCPACGQKATAGRITWTTVRSGVMDVWGLGSRSLVRSLWNLIVRPGSFISDYINGKWQVSFPPVKMLVIVAISLYFIGRLIYPEFWNDLFDEEKAESAASGAVGFIDNVVYWIVSHPEWALLFLLSSLIVPTWFVFRHAPRNTLHTLPQGFFIQVFLCVQFYLWLFVLSAIFRLCGAGLELAFTISFAVMLPVMVYVDYKSLFGYGWWGTLWRLVVSFQLAYMILAVLIFTSVICDRLVLGGDLSIPMLFVRLLCVVAFIVLYIFVIDMINRRTWRTAGRLKALKYPLIMLGVMLVLVVIGELVAPGSISKLLTLFYFG
ncbi:MAG: DUF3667 domain-containing protein [Muribaculaceae bacterium]|nr:DUF3667 domain-containing protein [Muribaculaceae bacterium]MBR5673518.1 DUF3667 domain-containing protein [Muribaculaceae bacterium]